MFGAAQPNAGVQRVFAWTGVVMLVLFLVGFWVVAGYVPPSGPHETVGQIVHFYASNTTAIHLGLWMTMLAAAFCATFFTVISVQMRRIEGPHSPLAFAQMLLGGLFVIEFIIPLMIWQAADYRPTLNPSMTYRLHDMGWLFFLGVVSTAVLQALLIAWAILRDRREHPIFPRWVAYTSVWCALLFMPGGLIVFFKSGPLDWRGLIAWWLLLVAFGIWVVMLVYTLLVHAIPHQEREARELAASQADGARAPVAGALT
jgi:hypothetical protein